MQISETIDGDKATIRFDADSGDIWYEIGYYFTQANGEKEYKVLDTVFGNKNT